MGSSLNLHSFTLFLAKSMGSSQHLCSVASTWHIVYSVGTSTGLFSITLQSHCQKSVGFSLHLHRITLFWQKVWVLHNICVVSHQLGIKCGYFAWDVQFHTCIFFSHSSLHLHSFTLFWQKVWVLHYICVVSHQLGFKCMLSWIT